MLRILVVGILSVLLASCSGSSRLEEIVPDWAKTPPRHPATQYAAPKNQSQGRTTLAAEPRATPAAEPRATPAAEPRGAPAAEPQEAKKTEGQSPSEE
jgi:hypothetical protein